MYSSMVPAIKFKKRNKKKKGKITSVSFDEYRYLLTTDDFSVRYTYKS